MGKKYIKIDVGDVIIDEYNNIGMIIACDRTKIDWERTKLTSNPCAEIALTHSSLSFISSRRPKKIKPDLSFTIKFPSINNTQSFFARDISNYIRRGIWKHVKKKIEIKD